jgi:hypothetical protein
MVNKNRGIVFLIITVVLIIFIVWQVSYYMPRIDQANKNVDVTGEAVRLNQIWVDCAQARVDAIEQGISAPDCTTEKTNALNAAARAEATQ